MPLLACGLLAACGSSASSSSSSVTSAVAERVGTSRDSRPTARSSWRASSSTASRCRRARAASGAPVHARRRPGRRWLRRHVAGGSGQRARRRSRRRRHFGGGGGFARPLPCQPEAAGRIQGLRRGPPARPVRASARRPPGRDRQVRDLRPPARLRPAQAQLLGQGPVFPSNIQTNPKFQTASQACAKLLVPARGARAGKGGARHRLDRPPEPIEPRRGRGRIAWAVTRWDRRAAL